MKNTLPSLVLTFLIFAPVRAQLPAATGNDGAKAPPAEAASPACDPAKLLNAAWAAEKQQHWADAAACFQIYLTLDGASATAEVVREELKNIQWRATYLSSPEAAQLPALRKEEEEVLEMLMLGFPLEAVQKALDMIGRNPRQWRNYFLVASAFEKLGNFDAAKKALMLGVPFMDKDRLALGDKVYAGIETLEKQTVALKKAEQLLKSSKSADAAKIYRELVKENPRRPEYRKLAIQTSLLAEEYDAALSLIEDNPFPEGQAMSADIRAKLVHEVTELKKRKMALYSGKGTSGGSGTGLVKKTGGSSMSGEFLNRVRRK